MVSNRRAMRAVTSGLGWSLAGLNVLVFASILAVKQPEYGQLRERDKKFWNDGVLEMTSADPMHLAGRPFYSSAHVAHVPLTEDLYFIANIPAMAAALSVSYPVARLTFERWTGSYRTSSAWGILDARTRVRHLRSRLGLSRWRHHRLVA